MNVGVKIGLGVGIPIAVFVSLIALDVYASSSIQIARNSAEEFDFTTLSIDTSMLACNPTFFPASFDKITLHLYYESTRLGELIIWGDNIPAHTARDVGGRFSLDGMNMLQLFLGAFVGGLAGQQIEFNPDDMNVYMKVEKSILGFIPYSFEERLTASEFRGIFQNGEQNWSC